MSDKLNIVVLAGGFSEEKEVSYNSGKAIYDSFIKQGQKALLIDPATGLSLLDNNGNLAPAKVDVRLISKNGYDLEKALNQDDVDKPDVIFLALHGGAGEDGTIQALFDLAGIKYTGSNQLASAIAMNKAFSKDIARNENIPTPDWALLNKNDVADLDSVAGELAGNFSLPFIIKPNDSGSTVGLTLVKEKSQILTALEAAFEVSDNVLVEQYIRGREITAAVLFGQELPLVEIVPSGELYDYQCKYTKGGSEYHCPADIELKTKSDIQDYAKNIYNKINCSGLARVDFILGQDNIPYFLELNTLPGMTELSLAPMAAKEAGIDFDQLVTRIITGSIDGE